MVAHQAPKVAGQRHVEHDTQHHYAPPAFFTVDPPELEEAEDASSARVTDQHPVPRKPGFTTLELPISPQERADVGFAARRTPGRGFHRGRAKPDSEVDLNADGAPGSSVREQQLPRSVQQWLELHAQEKPHDNPSSWASLKFLEESFPGMPREHLVHTFQSTSGNLVAAVQLLNEQSELKCEVQLDALDRPFVEDFRNREILSRMSLSGDSYKSTADLGPLPPPASKDLSSDVVLTEERGGDVSDIDEEQPRVRASQRPRLTLAALVTHSRTLEKLHTGFTFVDPSPRRPTFRSIADTPIGDEIDSRTKSDVQQQAPVTARLRVPLVNSSDDSPFTGMQLTSLSTPRIAAQSDQSHARSSRGAAALLEHVDRVCYESCFRVSDYSGRGVGMGRFDWTQSSCPRWSPLPRCSPSALGKFCMVLTERGSLSFCRSRSNEWHSRGPYIYKRVYRKQP